MHVTPATVIAGLALVFAMSGGAYAAKKYLITSTKQISPSVLKQLQGKAGAGGVPGAAGAQGSAGPAGSGGAKGETGPAGAKGETGTKGSAGVTGPTGSPWTVGGTLPSGATETGTWNVGSMSAHGGFFTVAISFPIPLSAASSKAHAFDLKETQEEQFGSSGCKGSLEHPTAPAGTLCVYTGYQYLEEAVAENFELRLPNENVENGYGTTGSILWGINPLGAGAVADVSGTWAVTAP
jgi:hypothetical protein